MNYALQTLWHERSRFLPGILAVAFSAVLIALQCGLLLGLFSITSIPIDHTRADVWVGSPKVLSVDLGRPIPIAFMSRVAGDPRVQEVEAYFQAFASWTRPDGGSDLCVVIGCDLNDSSMGAVSELTPEMRVLLTQPGSIIVDEGEFDRLGVKGLNDKAEINRQTVRIVGLVKGMRSLAGAYVFCSRETARNLLRPVMPSDHTTYYLLKCKKPEDAAGLAADLQKQYPEDMAVFTSRDFSLHSQLHWLMKTKAGIAIGYAAILGLLVGMVVTSQTLYAATTASAREYAILLALGIPRWRISGTVLVQSFWVGIIGVIVAYPTVNGLSALAALGGVNVLLPWWLLAGAAGVTMFMAMFSGMLALRSVRQIEPMTLLR
ncbi:MAG: ABC transporter permease [Planctomycetes bacterium]|nr:ABC transporter permease [Planctomycetota bacterium]